jgi:hypothetical protein
MDTQEETLTLDITRHAFPDTNLADTPDDGIEWQAMTAFIEYYETLDFNASGYQWKCVTGSTRLTDTPGPDGHYEWEYWYRAAPIGLNGDRDETMHQKQTGFPSHAEAQAACVAALRKVREWDVRPSMPSRTTPRGIKVRNVSNIDDANLTLGPTAKMVWKEIPHVAAVGMGEGRIVLVCDSCDCRLAVKTPVTVGQMRAWLKAFATEHAICERREENA